MRSILVALVALLLFPSLARAGDAVIIESYVGPRPKDATRVLEPLFDELTKLDFVGGSDVVGRRFESHASRPSATAVGLSPTFVADVDRGHNAWIQGQFDVAMKELVPLIQSAHANGAAFAKDTSLRESLRKAEIALALTYLRSGDRRVTKDMFQEILRSFDATLSRSSYGPDAFDQFEQARKALEAEGKGTLVIKERSGGAIYVNERFHDVGEVKLQLYPGKYRVFAKLQGNQFSRTHLVDVVAREEVKLALDADFDSTIHTTPTWSGLAFVSAGEREKLEPKYAATFAKEIDASSVAVIGIEQVRGRPVVFGALVSLLNGVDIRRATVALDPAPPETMLRGLARFIYGGTTTPGLQVQIAGAVRGAGVTNGDQRHDPSHASPASPVWSGWKYVTGGVGAAAIGTGLVLLLHYDGKCSVPGMSPCASSYHTAVPGWLSIGGGAVLAGLSAYLFIRGDGSSRKRTAFVVPASGGAIAGYAATF
jgi:hypothetical protein